MTPSNIQAFFAHAETDPQLHAEVARLTEEANRTLATSLARLSESTATPFSAEDFLASQATQELSEAELDSVAGGQRRPFTSIGTIILPSTRHSSSLD